MFARYRDPRGTPREMHRRLRRLWLREMCEHVGVPPRHDTAALAEETFAWVNERLSASSPGVLEGLRSLKARGFRLFIERHALARCRRIPLRDRARDLFDETYGTDLVDRWKTNAGFYRKILEHAGVPADDAVTVDDQERCLDWARRAGLRPFLLASAGTESKHETIATLAQLLDRI